MIADSQKQHHFAVTRLSALLRGVGSARREDFFSLNCLPSFRNKLDSQEKVCKNTKFCEVVIHDEEAEILKYHQGNNEDLKGLHKTFCDTTKKCENKNLS